MKNELIGLGIVLKDEKGVRLEEAIPISEVDSDGMIPTCFQF